MDTSSVIRCDAARVPKRPRRQPIAPLARSMAGVGALLVAVAVVPTAEGTVHPSSGRATDSAWSPGASRSNGCAPSFLSSSLTVTGTARAANTVAGTNWLDGNAFAPAAFGGGLRAQMAHRHAESKVERSLVFKRFGLQPHQSHGALASMGTTHDGELPVSTPGRAPAPPGLLVGTAARVGRSLTFDRGTGQLVVVPEPSTIAITGVGGVMTLWTMFKQHRRRVRSLRPVYDG